MSIRFACKCGKHLRAGDTMAGRRTLCPKCGTLLSIPKKEEEGSGAALARPVPIPPPLTDPALNEGVTNPEADDAEDLGPILIRVRRKNDKDPNRHHAGIWMPLDPDRGPAPEKLPKPARKARRRYNWQLETHWYQSLGYPFRAWRVLTALAAAQTALIVWVVTLIPRVSAGIVPIEPLEPLICCLTCVVFAGYTLGLFDCFLSCAGAGEYRLVKYPGIDLGMPGAASWLLCFLAGPLVPGAFAVWYWQRCGDPDLLNVLILAQLAAVTIAYWLLEILAAREEGGWAASPVAVMKLLDRLGPRSLLAAVGGPLVGYYYLHFLVIGVKRWHVDGPFGLPSLVLAGLIGMFTTAFLLRLLGVWSYRTRPAEERSQKPDAKTPAEVPEEAD
jgi:hypothetical protein